MSPNSLLPSSKYAFLLHRFNDALSEWFHLPIPFSQLWSSLGTKKHRSHPNLLLPPQRSQSPCSSPISSINFPFAEVLQLSKVAHICCFEQSASSDCSQFRFPACHLEFRLSFLSILWWSNFHPSSSSDPCNTLLLFPHMGHSRIPLRHLQGSFLSFCHMPQFQRHSPDLRMLKMFHVEPIVSFQHSPWVIHNSVDNFNTRTLFIREVRRLFRCCYSNFEDYPFVSN